MKHWKLWTLTCAVILLSLLVVIFVDSDKTSALGSIFAASSGFIAVIWFYNSLELQSVQLQEQQKQLEEQRVQFQLEFNNIRLEAKGVHSLLQEKYSMIWRIEFKAVLME